MTAQEEALRDLKASTIKWLAEIARRKLELLKP